MRYSRFCPVSCRNQVGPRRAGWTLVELLTVISITAILANICVRMLVIIMQVQSSFGVQAAMELTQQRLEDRLRGDVHQATAAEVLNEPEGNKLRLILSGDRAVEYLLQRDRVLRQVPGDEQAREYDQFSLPGYNADAAITADAVSLTLTESIPRSLTPRVTVVVARLPGPRTPNSEEAP